MMKITNHYLLCVSNSHNYIPIDDETHIKLPIIRNKLQSKGNRFVLTCVGRACSCRPAEAMEVPSSLGLASIDRYLRT